MAQMIVMAMATMRERAWRILGGPIMLEWSG